MGLFGKKDKTAVNDIGSLWALPEETNYQSALDFLVGLSAKDYTKVINVADIHRKALQESAAVLGKPNEPTTFIDTPMPADEPDFLDDDAKPKAKGRKIKVNQ